MKPITFEDVKNFAADFKRFNLRLPKYLYNTIEELSWADKVSMNIEVNDLLIIALQYLLSLKPEDFPEERRSLMPYITEKKKNFAEKANANDGTIDNNGNNEFVQKIADTMGVYMVWRQNAR